MYITRSCRASNRTHSIKRAIENYTFVVFLVFTVTMVWARAVDEKIVPNMETEVRRGEVVNVIAEELNMDLEMYPASCENSINEDASLMAKVIYGACRYNSVDAQRSVCWVILNRVDSPLFPNDIKGVCVQPNQWMGFSEDNPVVQETYDMCKEVMEAWEMNSIRPFGKDFCFFVWNGNDSVTLRNSYEKTANTRYMEIG